MVSMETTQGIQTQYSLVNRKLLRVFRNKYKVVDGKLLRVLRQFVQIAFQMPEIFKIEIYAVIYTVFQVTL